MRAAAAAGALGLALAAAGAALDRLEWLPQPWLWAAMQAASLGGAALGAALALGRARRRAQRVRLAVGALLGWRLAYFPVMVFAGHLTGLAEWTLAGLGLAPAIWPLYLLAVAGLHAAAARATAALLIPRHAGLAAASAAAFALAAAVSFLRPADLVALPDRAWRLEAPLPRRSAPRANPYLPALGRTGYAPHQRFMLLAAGLTYETIPSAPWARTVKGTLEALFRARPHASTHDRLREHYLAYHVAQARIAGGPEPRAGARAPAP